MDLAATSRNRWRWLRIGLLGALAIALLAVPSLLGLRGAGALAQLTERIDALGPLAPAAYIGCAIVGTIFLLPGSVTKLAAGALFGLAGGIVWGFVAAFLASLPPFWIARRGPRVWLARRLPQAARARAFDDSLARDGRLLTVLLRLSPVVPYNALNYALGVSPVRLRDYLLAAPAMMPSVVIYAYAGYLARALALEAPPARPWWEWLLVAVGLLATITATTLITRKARAALRGRAHDDPEPRVSQPLLRSDTSAYGEIHDRTTSE